MNLFKCKSNNSSLINHSNASRNQWYSPNGHYNIRMEQSGTRLNFRALPVSSSGIGVTGCYDSFSGATKLKENDMSQKGAGNVRNINCR